MAKKGVQDLPQTVYVSRQNLGTDDEYLQADEDRAALVDDDGEIVYVGEYKLVDWVKLRRSVEVVK